MSSFIHAQDKVGLGDSNTHLLGHNEVCYR